MYRRRLYSFVFICGLAVSLCLVRLGHLQLVEGEGYRKSIEEARILETVQLPTIRGRILDRDGNILAVDTASFNLYIHYSLTRLLDDRFRRCSIISGTDADTTAEKAELALVKDLQEDYASLDKVLDVCDDLQNGGREQLEARIQKINDYVWNMRELFAWRWNSEDSETKVKYKANRSSVDPNEIRADFERQYPDEKERCRLLLNTRLKEMTSKCKYKLVELMPGEEVFRAQNELAGIAGIEIDAEAKRKYPEGSAACQIIGWVGSVSKSDLAYSDPNDVLSKYLPEEVSGQSGVEKVCEFILRGRRGKVKFNDTGERVEHEETQFGEDVRLSLDIKLQHKIESFLSDPNENAYAYSGIGAVVIDVASGDVLSLVSIPVFDLNTIRQNYNELIKAANKPFVHKAMFEHYPPGSTVKPIVLTAALEEGKLRSGETISCPSQAAPESWPDCLRFREYRMGHDQKWANTARNAIKGSCNVFFSHLANRLKPEDFQEWFFKFGYGRKILPGPFGTRYSTDDMQKGMDRFLPESRGQLSYTGPAGTVESVEDLGKLHKGDLKQFGIGQGRFTATVLQVANAAAVLARGGVYRDPRLFLNDSDASTSGQVNLGISSSTLNLVRDAMYAAVNEVGGTGYSAFEGSSLRTQGVKVFGKTGSTTGKRKQAWFMCFAEDTTGRAISFAIVVEGGEGGSTDAAPLARRILEFCNEAGYIGKRPGS
jgi:penicillin-binding protein 2